MNPVRQRAPAAFGAEVRELSDRIVDAQRDIRILDAVSWTDEIANGFLAAGGTRMPAVDAAYYASRPLPFVPDEKRQEFRNLGREIARRLGDLSPVSTVMQRICREYEDVVEMLEARGTPEFGEWSRRLYGSATDVFHAGEPTLADLGGFMSAALETMGRDASLQDEPPSISAPEAVDILQKRMNDAFLELGHEVRVQLSDGVLADAAAGARHVKLRADARFTERDLRVLEVHEGWVHLGTTLNGARQPYCSFLSKGPPSATITQEGLAILIEVTSLASHPARLRRITNRIRAIELAEKGADFMEVFRFFRDAGFETPSSYQGAVRVFRGGLPTGGAAFTKDLSYCKGFVQVYNFLQLAIRRGALDRIPLLFCGKTILQDVPALASLVEEGLVDPPAFLPPPIRDLSALASWMCFAQFFHHLSLDRIETDYAGLLPRRS